MVCPVYFFFKQWLLIVVSVVQGWIVSETFGKVFKAFGEFFFGAVFFLVFIIENLVVKHCATKLANSFMSANGRQAPRITDVSHSLFTPAGGTRDTRRQEWHEWHEWHGTPRTRATPLTIAKASLSSKTPEGF